MIGEQRTFASVAWTQRGKVTRRERFLAEIECGDSVAAVAGTDRTALSEGWERAAVARTGEYAAPHVVAAGAKGNAGLLVIDLDTLDGGTLSYTRIGWNRQCETSVST